MDKNETMILMAVLGVAIGLLGFSMIYKTVSSTGYANAPSSGDLTPPVVRINSPQNNGLWQQTVFVSVTATDNVRVKEVQLILDEKLYDIDTTKPYDFLIKTIYLSNGSHLLKAIAIDAENNVSQTSTITVRVDNISE